MSDRQGHRDVIRYDPILHGVEPGEYLYDKSVIDKGDAQIKDPSSRIRFDEYYSDDDWYPTMDSHSSDFEQNAGESSKTPAKSANDNREFNMQYTEPPLKDGPGFAILNEHNIYDTEFPDNHDYMICNYPGPCRKNSPNFKEKYRTKDDKRMVHHWVKIHGQKPPPDAQKKPCPSCARTFYHAWPLTKHKAANECKRGAPRKGH
ncbi:hypothetical protein GLAREA_04071 [Glarea lozoyensis ATCC 20868]|uniref:Uncharacterized protein n=1 Tax=Glarea lozoyensis (strain ATCC 20868 / MF5171) TaxID=1116229 RepID=S3D1R0_GLAL2|nr:uncharacterized protein GLAREA_04071 [Glarea lozoyensis ATCC 20868]EPE31104.1 hypothetical protein GLAREA_04071 [Glarea lozoyensis ATCC 20868]